MTPLSEDYSPGPFDVICARGKEARTHAGNCHFAMVIAQSITQYSQASSKFEKSVLVSEIVRSIRSKSPNGGFVKKENGKWFEVGDHLAREKVGQSLRDLLHTQYKSSTKAKKRRRQEESARVCDDMLETVLRSNEYMPKRMKQLSHSIQSQGLHASDMYMSLMMTQANCDILEAIKKDANLQKVIQENASLSSNVDRAKTGAGASAASTTSTPTPYFPQPVLSTSAVSPISSISYASMPNAVLPSLAPPQLKVTAAAPSATSSISRDDNNARLKGASADTKSERGDDDESGEVDRDGDNNEGEGGENSSPIRGSLRKSHRYFMVPPPTGVFGFTGAAAAMPYMFAMPPPPPSSSPPAERSPSKDDGYSSDSSHKLFKRHRASTEDDSDAADLF